MINNKDKKDKKSYGDKINTKFQVKNTKKNASYEFLSLIMLGSIIRVNKKYYFQTLLEECKYEINGNGNSYQ